MESGVITGEADAVRSRVIPQGPRLSARKSARNVGDFEKEICRRFRETKSENRSDTECRRFRETKSENQSERLLQKIS